MAQAKARAISIWIVTVLLALLFVSAGPGPVVKERAPAVAA